MWKGWGTKGFEKLGGLDMVKVLTKSRGVELIRIIPLFLKLSGWEKLIQKKDDRMELGPVHGSEGEWGCG